MAKFLKIGSDGMPTEEAGITTSAGAGDSGKIPALDGGGKLAYWNRRRQQKFHDWRGTKCRRPCVYQCVGGGP